MAQRTLTVVEKVTNQKVDIPVVNNAFSANHFAKIKIKPTTPASNDPSETVPIRLYDPGFKNTAVCNTAISNVDPEGRLFYRGYDVEQLFNHSTFLEVSYLLIFGDLPSNVSISLV
jgi:citrate synthase